ncbi:hypothetical protein GCM10010216_02630 [Streptomyces flaveolus]|nr:hypothetical protein GCM10010216_02630 [Streptomyces flaveolus]
MAATDEERGGKRRGSSPAGSLLAERPDGLHFSELWKLVVASLSLTEEDMERPKSGDTKGENAWKWQTSDLVMAGWLRLRAGGSAASLAAVRRALPIPGAPPPGRGRGSPAQAGSEGIPSSDLYQMLAYCTSLGLSFGHLVYAKGRSPRGPR